MRLIIILFTSLLIATAATASETPAVCQAYYGQEKFAENDLYRDDSEIVALLGNLYSEFPPSMQEESSPNLALRLFRQLYYKDVEDARQARIAYEAVVADFTDGEILYEDAMSMVRTMLRVDGMPDTYLLLEHLGADDHRSAEITAVIDCYEATLIMMSEDYRHVYNELAMYFHNQEIE